MKKRNNLMLIAMTFVAILLNAIPPAWAINTIETSTGTKSVIKLLFVSAGHSNKAKVNLLERIASEDTTLSWEIAHKAARDLSDLTQLQSLFNEHDLVILDAVSSREASKTYQPFISAIDANKIEAKLIAFNWLTNQDAQLSLTQAEQTRLSAYWKNGGRVNLTNMLNYVGYHVLAKTTTTYGTAVANIDVPAPIVFPTKGIYHPKQPSLISNNLVEYRSWSKPKPNQVKIGLLMQRALIETEQTQLIDQTIAQLEAKGAYVVPFFFKLSPTSGDYSELVQLPTTEKDTDDKRVTAIDLIINFRNIHWASKRKTEFEHFGVPVMQAMTYYGGNQQDWEADKQGVSSGMMAFTLVLPESAGVVDPMIVAAVDRKTQTTEVIDYQLTHLVNKAINVARLKYTPNADKKLTLFVWGDKDVGASFMNVPESISAISETLAKQGYTTDKVDPSCITDNISKILDPFYRDYQLSELIEKDLAELMPIDAYLAWFNSLPKAITQKISDHWGEPKDHFMAVEKNGKHYFILPRIRNGNLLVMRQPPRSDNKNDENKIYHQGLVPMNHFYLAAYYYAREYWQSDAIIHLGTHGSQEYLGGKERGLSIYDQGNLAAWDTPIVYPFIVDDVGEAMQTKRRGRATVISHMTPPFAAAGLHGEISQLHELMHQFKQLDEGGVKVKTAKQIVDQCFNTNLCKDIDWKKDQIAADYAEFFDVLHNHLDSLAMENQPLGLHTFGHLSEQDLVISTLVQMLGKDFIALAGELEDTYKAHGEHNSTHKTGSPHAEHPNNGHSHAYHKSKSTSPEVTTQQIATAQIATAQIATAQIATPQSAAQLGSHPDIKNLIGYRTVLQYIVLEDDTQANRPVAFDDLEEALQSEISRGKTLYKRMKGIHELDAMVDFLSAKYIPVKTGGDPIRHPDSLATGYNLYGFDPSRVPTKAAYQQGKELVVDMIANYQKKHGKFPDKMAFSLWSIETMRHYGVLEAQVMYAMGVKPIWTADGRVRGTEIIPYSELKRPRIDVVLSATGLYRDAFPNVMQLLAKAVKQVADLKDETNSHYKNYVRENSQRLQAELIEQGVEEDDAQYFSTVRIFSNRSGDYGSGVDDATWASDTWETDKKISDNYLNKMGYFFGTDDSRWGEQAKNAKGEKIGLYAQQLSGTDIAMFARSSNLFGMLSSDDPFEYFGGLSLAVRNIDGKSPDMLISNLRDANNARAEDAALFMAKELRTRMLHPRWIKEMQKEGYSGAASLASRMDNFFGWQVVDPNLVRNDQWDEYLDVYVNDKLDLKLDEWFEKTNPNALARMMERMLEAERKDYWQADETRLKQLVERYIEMVNTHNLVVLNDALKENVDALALGFGLQPLTNAKSMSDMAKQTVMEQQNQQNIQAIENKNINPAEQVEGQKLEKQQTEAQEPKVDSFLWQALSIVLLILFAGAYFQTRAKPLRQFRETQP